MAYRFKSRPTTSGAFAFVQTALALAADYPAAASVWHGADVYGNGAYTPSMRASSIASCESANIVTGVTIDDVAGDYPLTAVSYAAGYSAGEDAGAAAQYSADQGAVLAIKEYLDNTQTCLGIPGELDMSLYMELLVADPSVGPLTGSIQALERMLSYCPAFQTRVEAATAAEALKHIFLFDYEAETAAELRRARPFAAIWPADRLDLDQVAGGQRIAVKCSGELVLLLTDTDRHPGMERRRESYLDFVGWVDQIILWLKDHSNESDYLTISKISFLQGVAHSPKKDEKSEGAYYHCALLVEWN